MHPDMPTVPSLFGHVNPASTVTLYTLEPKHFLMYAPKELYRLSIVNY
jgi:hypothetical protein